MAIVYQEPTPAWVATTDPALPWRVQTSQYVAEMADYLDAGAQLGGMLWRFTHCKTGRIMTYSPEAVAFIDHLQQFDPMQALAHVQAAVSGDTITFDHPAYRVTYQALVDRLKLTILLKPLFPLRAPNPALVTAETAFLTLTGGIELPADLETWDRTGKRTGDFATRGEVYLKDATGNVVQFLDRVTARDSEGHPGAGEIRLVTDADGTRRLYQGMSWGWLQVASFQPTAEFPEGGVEIDPTVVTSTSALATAYPNQRKMTRLAGGNLFMTVFNGANAILRYSTDNGQTWADAIAPTSIGTQQALHLERDSFDNMHLAGYTPSGPDITIRSLVTAANKTSVSLANFTTFVAANGDRVPAAAVHPEGTDQMLHVFWGEDDNATNSYLKYYSVPVAANGTWGVSSGLTTQQTIAWSGAPVNKLRPTVDVDGSKNLTITWIHGNSLFGWRWTYNAGAWTKGTVKTLATDVQDINYWSSIVDASGRLLFSYRSNAGGTPLNLKRWNLDDTITDLSMAGKVATWQALTYDNSNRPQIIFVDGSGVLQYATATTTTWTGITTIPKGAGALSNLTARRGSEGASYDVTWTEAGTPNIVATARISVNEAPLMPTLTTAAAAFDAVDGVAITILANDPNQGDTMSAYALKRIIAGVTEWWNATTKAWVSVETWNAVSGTSATILAADNAGKWTNPVGPGYAAQKPQLYAATRDAAGATGPYTNTAVQVTVSAKPTVTPTTPIANQVIFTPRLTAAWTTSDPEGKGQGAYRVRLLDASNVQIETTGKVSDTGARSRSLTTTLTNTTTYKLEFTVWDADDVASVPVTVTFSTNWTPPAIPVPTATPNPDQFPPDVTIKVGNPAPTGGQPAVTGNRIERRRVGSTDPWDNRGTCGANGSLKDPYGASAVMYEYRVAAVGNNQTEAYSAPVVAGIDRDCWWFVPISDPTLAIPFAFNREASWQHDRAFTEVSTLGPDTVHFTGGKKRDVVNITATYVDPQFATPHAAVSLGVEAWRQRFISLAFVKGYLLSPQGFAKKGILEPPQGQFVRDMVLNPITVSCRFVEKGG